SATVFAISVASYLRCVRELLRRVSPKTGPSIVRPLRQHVHTAMRQRLGGVWGVEMGQATVGHFGDVEAGRARASYARVRGHAPLANGLFRLADLRPMQLLRIPSPPVRQAELPTVALRAFERELALNHEARAAPFEVARISSSGDIFCDWMFARW